MRTHNSYFHQRRLLILSLGLFVLLGTLMAFNSLDAAKKVNVYQGVIAINPDGSEVLELGNRGTDITSNGPIIFRPRGMGTDRTIYGTHSRAIEFDGSRGVTDVYVPGRLCVGGTCSNTWPTTAGTSLWQFESATATLRPNTTAGGNPRAVDLSLNAAANGSVLKAVNNSALNPTVHIGNANAAGSAAQFKGQLYVNGVLIITPTDAANPMTINGARVWYSGNDGPPNYASQCNPAALTEPTARQQSCGPDADLIDGVNSWLAWNAAGWNSTRKNGSTPDAILNGASFKDSGYSYGFCISDPEDIDPGTNLPKAKCIHLDAHN